MFHFLYDVKSETFTLVTIEKLIGLRLKGWSRRLWRGLFSTILAKKLQPTLKSHIKKISVQLF
jgi:hypothetical protein